MKIALCLFSNRPSELSEFCRSFHNAMVTGNRYAVCVNLQKPEFKRIEIELPAGVELRYSFSERVADDRWIIDGIETGPVFDFARARLVSLKLAGNDFDFLISGNDDYRFLDCTKIYRFSAGERYIDCCRYLDSHKTCGIVLCKAFLGGSSLERRIVPMNGGCYEAGLGMVMRGVNRPCEFLDERLIAPGVCEEMGMCVTAIINGYYIAKAFNTPIRVRPSKKVIPNGTVSDNAIYYPEHVIEYSKTQGVIGRLEKLFDDYHWPGKLSPKILAAYRDKASRLGHELVY